MPAGLWRYYEAAVNAVASTIFAAMVVVTATGVFFRYALDAALPWAEEADRYLFIWLAFTGSAITMRKKAHIAVDVLVRMLDARARAWVVLFTYAAVLAFLGFVMRASEIVIEVTSLTRTPATDIPMSWVYTAVPVGCTLIAIETLRLMAATWRELRGGGPGAAGAQGDGAHGSRR